MHAKKKTTSLLLAALFAGTPVFAGTVPDAGTPPPPSVAVVAPAREDLRYTTTQDMKIETLLTVFFLERAHILEKRIAEMDMNELIEDNCYALDTVRAIFLQSDVDELKARFAPTLSDYIGRGNLHAAFTIYKTFARRLEERVARIDARLKSPETFDLERGDSLPTDLEDARWPEDSAAADELWEKRLTSEIITELLGGEKEETAAAGADAGVPAAANPTPEAVAAACEKLRERYAKLRDNLALEPWEVEEIFLNSLTTRYDPHTTFFSKQSMEEFEISMRNSLCGIGAVLTMEDGYCTIREIMPGSPVERSGKIAVGDRIVAVGRTDDGSALTDVVGMRLSRIVRMLRGEKGVPVRLLVESGTDHSRRIVTLVRDEIKLTEQLAFAQLIDVPAGGATVPVGVISLPSFYGKDRSGGASFSTAEDVKELLGKLKKAGARAIVLDLRVNGGGYLNEAVDLLELFVGRGVPVLQTRGANGRPETLCTGDTSAGGKFLGWAMKRLSTPEWTGPVVVLVSKISASASEIVAGALQDNRRAIVVGDPHTHGKGSVQEVIPFKAYDSSQEASIKLTRSKWYAPSGNSIQIRGVSADIVTPSRYSVLPVGEGDLDRPLPWDSVPSALSDELPSWMSAPVSPELIAALAENNRVRQAELPEFLTLSRTVAWEDERMKDKSVPLSLRERLERKEDFKNFREMLIDECTALEEQTGFEKIEIKLDSAIAQEREAAESGAKKTPSLFSRRGSSMLWFLGNGVDDEELPDYDVQLREAARIAADWVGLLDEKKFSGDNDAAVPVARQSVSE